MEVATAVGVDGDSEGGLDAVGVAEGVPPGSGAGVSVGWPSAGGSVGAGLEPPQPTEPLPGFANDVAAGRGRFFAWASVSFSGVGVAVAPGVGVFAGVAVPLGVV